MINIMYRILILMVFMSNAALRAESDPDPASQCASSSTPCAYNCCIAFVKCGQGCVEKGAGYYCTVGCYSDSSTCHAACGKN